MSVNVCVACHLQKVVSSSLSLSVISTIADSALSATCQLVICSTDDIMKAYHDIMSYFALMCSLPNVIAKSARHTESETPKPSSDSM